MAIVFHCPFCQYGYWVKDELAGKTATCKNCRQKVVILKPNVSDTPPPKRADTPDGEIARILKTNATSFRTPVRRPE
jgi:hypothetical protein